MFSRSRVPRRRIAGTSYAAASTTARTITTASAFALLAAAIGAGHAHAQTQSEIDELRVEMEASMERLGGLSMGLFRVTMQDPNLERHAMLTIDLLESVRTDLDYIEALLELYGLARDPSRAGLVVIRELDGIRDRMQLDAFEQHVQFEDDPASTPRGLQVVERELLTELRHSEELFGRARALVDPTAR